MTYLSFVILIVSNLSHFEAVIRLIHLWCFSTSLLLPFLWCKLQRMGQRIVELKSCMLDVLAEERETIP